MPLNHPSFPEASGSRPAVSGSGKILQFPNEALDAADAGMPLDEFKGFRTSFGSAGDAGGRPDDDRYVLEHTLEDIKVRGALDETPEGRLEHARRRAFFFREWLLRTQAANPAKAYVFLEDFVGSPDFQRLPPVPCGRILTQWTSAIGCAGMYGRYAQASALIQGHVTRLHDLSHDAADAKERKRLVGAFAGIAINASELSWGLGKVENGLQLCRSAAAEASECGLRKWESAARAHAAQMLVRMGKLGEARQELERSPEEGQPDTLVRRELAEIELAIREGAPDEETLGRLEKVDAKGFDANAWKRYLWGLVWSRKAGVAELSKRNGEAPTERHVNPETRERARETCVKGLEEYLSEAVRACDDGKDGWENQVPLIEPMALLSRTYRKPEKKREWALRAWAAFRNHFSSVTPDSGFDPLSGAFAEAAYGAAAEAFADDLDEEPKPRDQRRLDALHKEWERDRVDALEAELSARRDVDRPHELFKILRRDCGVSSVLIVPLDPGGAMETRSFGFSPAVVAYPKQDGIRDDMGKLRDYLARQAEIDSSQTGAYRRPKKENTEYDQGVIAEIVRQHGEKLLKREKFEAEKGGAAEWHEAWWCDVNLPLSYVKYAVASMRATVLPVNGRRYLVAADRGDKRLLPLTRDMERRVATFARHYVEFAESVRNLEETRAAGKEAETFGEALFKSLTAQGRLAIEQVRLLGATEAVIRRVSHEINTFLTCGQATQERLVDTDEFGAQAERFVAMVEELNRVYAKTRGRRKAADAGEDLIARLDGKDPMDRTLAAAVRQAAAEADARAAGRGAHGRGPLLDATDAADLARAALEKLGAKESAAGRWVAGRGITFDASGCAGVAALADEEAEEAVTKVAVAAARTAPDGATVFLSAETRGAFAALAVRAKLAAPHLNLAFKPEHFDLFGFRGNSVTMPDAGHKTDLALGCDDLGTGLALARLIVEERGGSVNVPPQPQGEAVAELLFPAVPRDS